MHVRRPFQLLLGGVGAVVAVLALAGCTPQVTLQGRLTRTGTGANLAGVSVSVYANGSETVVAHTVTNTDGTYDFTADALPGGTYRVRFSEADWWQAAGSWAAATPVTVSTAGPTVIDEVLTPATGKVTGLVTDGSAAPLGSTTVLAYTTLKGNQVAVTSTVSAGTYTLNNLPVGTYRIFFRKAGYTYRFSGSAPNPAVAPIVTVTAGATTTGVNTTLIPQATVSGEFLVGANIVEMDSGNVFDPAESISGMTAQVFDIATGSSITTATSNALGRFTALGLNPGTYGVRYSDPQHRYRSGSVSGTVTVASGDVKGVGTVRLRGWDCPSTPPAPGTDLSGKLLMNCPMQGWDLHGTNFTGANLRHAWMDSTNLAAAQLQGATLEDAILWHANFQDANLTNANFSQTLVAEANFAGTNMSGTIFTFNQLLSFLQGFPSVTSGGITGTPLGDAHVVGGYLIEPGVNLAGANLAGLDLSGRFLRGANLTGADLSSADLTGADLTATLDGANLHAANLTSASLVGASLVGANLDAADLSNADILGATGQPVGAATAVYLNSRCPDMVVVSAPATCIGHGWS